jgi:hypothetical protein
MQKKNLIRTNPIKTVELLFLKIPALNSFQISHDSDNFDSVVSHAEEAKSALNILAFTSDYYIYTLRYFLYILQSNIKRL